MHFPSDAALSQPKSESLAGEVAASGITERIAKHIVTLPYDALPEPIVQLTKQCLMDALGVSIGATGLAPEAKLVVDYVNRQGARRECTILGFGGKTTAALATFANGSFGHMLDYDDVCVTGHVSISTVPVALALAEREGNIHGRELIAAIAVGMDLMARLELAIPIPDWRIAEGWFATQLLGTFAATATAGRLLRLTPSQMEHALGIAYTQLGGSYQMGLGAACHLRSMQGGFAGQAGLLSADLAQSGITGSKQVFEGRFGFFSNYVRARSPRWDALGGQLGISFPVPEHHHFKQWPACDHTRGVTISLRKLFAGKGLAAVDVEKVEIIGGSGATRLLCEPIASKRRPASSVDAKFSIPFTAAIALVRGNVTLADYTSVGLSNVGVLQMAQKVSWREAPDASQAGAMPTVVVRLCNGETLTARATSEDLNRPAEHAFLVDKFLDCVKFSAHPVEPLAARAALAMINDIEGLADSRRIVDTLYPDATKT